MRSYAWAVEAGEVKVMVGGGSDSTPLKGSFNIATAPPIECRITDLGCFFDGGPPDYNRTLPFDASAKVVGATLTLESCAAACRKVGPYLELSGVEDGTQCFCGTKIDPSLVKPTGDCSRPCGGNTSQSCGGFNRLYVTNSTCN
jgi:hypothetical protein